MMRFCGMCGTALTTASLSPLSTTPDITAQQLGVMTGSDLEERFQRAGLETRAKRRAVTVLFVDVAGYTNLSEQVEGEELFTLVQRFTQVLANIVYKYEGAVDKFTGDGLMALFGAPIAHENHAELGVRAALDMLTDVAQLAQELQPQLGVELKLHLGLHTGTVIVGNIGSQQMMNYTAIGDTVNLARRLEEASAPASILVSETVYQQTKSLFAFEPVPALNLKGFQKPLPAYRVMASKAETGVARSGLEGLQAPMIGRETELKRLRESVHQLVEQRYGQFIFITGEAGLGKTRLISELKATLAAEPITIIEGHSLTYRRSAAYWIFIDALRRYLQVEPTTASAEVRARLREQMVGLLGPLVEDSLPYLEHLLSLEISQPIIAKRVASLDGARLRQQVFRAVREWLVAATHERPVLLILEDLHWADEVSLDLIRALVDSLWQAPLLICALSRPTLEGQALDLFKYAHKRLGERAARMELHSLALAESTLLLEQLMDVPDLPQRIREQILQRAAGNPFYLEEILRMLIDAGLLRRDQTHTWQLIASAEAILPRVPDTLQDLIFARFDRLTEAQRQILKIASVIGRQFNWVMLTAVLEHPARRGQRIEQADLRLALQRLAQREFIEPLPHAPEKEFLFKHALVSDAIYNTLLRRDRNELHTLVAEALEQVYANQLEEHIEVLARHYSWSTHHGKALHYLILAGQKAAREFANENARRYYTQALGLLAQVPHEPTQQIAIHTGLGDVLVFIGEYEAAREQYEAALNLLVNEGSLPEAKLRSGLERRMSKTYERQGNRDDALMCLSVALEALQESDDPDLAEKAQILGDIGWLNFRTGNLEMAQKLLHEALQLVENSQAQEVISSLYNRLGGVAYARNHWLESATYVRKSIALREAIGDWVELATSLNNLGLLEMELGEFDSALQNLTRSYELKSRQGQADGIAVALNNLGEIRLRRGELVEAKTLLQSAYDLARQIGYSVLIVMIQRTLGEVYLAEGDWQMAQHQLRQSLDLGRDLKANDQLPTIHCLLGQAALMAHNVTEAEQWARRLEQLAQDQAKQISLGQRGEAARFRGELACYKKSWDEALQHLQESAQIFRRTHNRFQLAHTVYQLGRLAEAQGNHQAALSHYQESMNLWQSTGAMHEWQRAEASLKQLQATI